MLLNQHPDVFLATPRETCFFYDDVLYSGGSTSYERNFFGEWDGQKAVGEKTPAYLFYEKTPARINDTLGDGVKLIVTLRSPAKRAHSHFRHNYQQLWEQLSFEDALKKEPKRISKNEQARAMYGYLERGKYAGQLKRYMDLFPKENIKTLIFEEDIIGNQEQLASDLFDYLEIARDVPLELPVSAGRPNIPEMEIIGYLETECEINNNMVLLPPGTIVIRFPSGKTQCIKSPSIQLRNYAECFQASVSNINRLSREAELEINTTHFKDDIEALSQLIDRDLSAWLQ